MSPARWAALVLVLLACGAGPGAVVDAAGASTVRYLLPSGVVGPNGQSVATPVSVRPCGLAPCAEEYVIGTPVFVLSEPVHQVTVRFFDDAGHENVPVTLCVDATADGVCVGTDFGPFCHPFAVWMTPAPAETVVYAHALVLNEALDMCSASRGYATATWS